MRILVLSDSHGDRSGVRQVLEENPEAEAVLFCGDGEEDIVHLQTFYPQKAFYFVRGNCDWGSQYPPMQLVELGGVKMMFAHGHTYSVKSSDSDILFAARSAGVQMVCYGHTHISRVEYRDGLHIVNPGSLRGAMGSYGVVDITAAGIVPFIKSRYRLKADGN